MLLSPFRRKSSRYYLLLNRSVALFLFLLLGATVGHAQSSSIAFVQSNFAVPQTPQSTVTVAYLAAQTVGDLNVVVVGWNDSTATVSSVADAKGNVYALAVGPTVQSGTATQAIYYAKNIVAAVANGNTVTVTFSTAAVFPDIRIAEYSGLDTVNPLDVSVGAQGTTTATSSSGSVATTNANDLLVGANLVQSTTTAAGAGYTSRGITADGDILEDQVVTATGSYSATAVLDKVQPWIMQMVAFRAAASGTAAPTITSLNPTSGTVGTSVTITGANFGASQGTSTVTFNGTAAAPTSWSTTSIAVPVPTGATTGNIVVTVGSVASNGVNFTVTTSGPSITSLNPTSGLVGASVTITGSNFGASQGTSTVTFNGTAATSASWSATSIAVPVPTGATTGNVVVTVGSVASNALNFTVMPPPPSTTSLNPVIGPVGTLVTIAGANFGTTQGTSTVTFNGTLATPASWSATSIAAPVPAGATTGTVVVTVGGQASNGLNFTVQSTAGPITLLQHRSMDAGTISSSTLAFASNNTVGNWIAVVIRAGKSGQVFTVSDSRANTYRRAIQFNETVDGTTLGLFYAENIAAGANTITVSDTISGTLRFAILEYSGVATSNSLDITATGQGTGSSPNSGNAPTTANGNLLIGEISSANPANFTAGSGYTAREFVPVEPSTKLLVEDQIQAAAGAVSASGTLGASDNWGAALAAFKAAAGSGGTVPSITSLNPTSGVVGTLVTITGTNFGATQGTSTVAFNGTAATPTSWGATSIAVPVPTGAITGNVVVTVGGGASNGVTFSVTAPPPSITTLTPTSGAIGASVAIAGTNFGATQGTSTVAFNGISATPTIWSATSITVPVPNGATTGNVLVTVNAVASNGVLFTVTSPGPSLSSLGLTQGPVGATVTVTGTNFGATQGTSTVTFNGTAGTPSVWTATSIDVPVPVGATTGNVLVTVGGVVSNGLPFTVTPPPNISTISPISGPIGAVVTIIGTNFGPTVGTRVSGVTFNGVSARTNSWSDTQILVPVPAGATSGNVVVSISGVASNGILFTVTPIPAITGVSPTSGLVGTSVTITGTSFGSSQGTSAVAFNGMTATPTSWNDTGIMAPVPAGATTGNVVVSIGGVASNGVTFTVTSSGAPIRLVQHASVDAGTTMSASLAFPAATTAGNWIAVVIRAGKSGQVFTVTDARANTYRKAIQFNETLDGTTLGVFYAENITGGANTINVFDTISGTLRFAILEYSGVTIVNSLDAIATTQGAGTSPSSGNLFTSVSGDLLLAGISTANAASFTAGSGYLTEELVPLQPNSKLLVEDQIQAAPAQVFAGASLGASDNWGAILAAFKSASGAPPPPITVTVLPATASVGNGGGTQPFTAQLTNDIQSKGVTWSLSGAGCSGSTCGTLSQVAATSVTYAGPATTPNPATVTLTATSVADNTKTSTATITIVQGSLTVTLTPKRGSITASQTQQFTATVFNDPNNAGVTWQVDGNTNGNSTTGTISAVGLFTPGTQPGSHTISATSVTNASASASVSFAVTDLAGMLMHHNDPGRTGQNVQEYALTPANVHSSAFTQLFSCPVDGYVYAQPLWVPNLTVGAAVHNVLFIATEHDSVYAFDADSPSCTQLWKKSFFGTGVTAMPWQDTSLGTSSLPTDDVSPEIGITSTPVINLATNTIYVVAKTKETVGTGCPCYISRLHAMDITTGAEKFGGPVVFSAPNFVSLRHFNRPGLLLANNTIYIGFGSHGDISNWQGWLFGYDPATLAQKFVFSTADPTNGSAGASLWGGGAGPAADASGNIYVTTGNGIFDGVRNFSESVLKISPTGTLLDSFTPSNRSTLDANDIDLGSAGIIILPDSVGSLAHPHLLMATGKIAVLYLLDQTNLGKFNSSANQDVQEVVPVPPPNTTQLDGGNYGVPAYWNGNIYTTGQNYPLSQFRISNGSMATPQFAVSSNMFPPRGAIPSVSANGNTNGIVWVLDLSGWPSNGNAILYAYDANNVSNLLFSSPSTGTGAAGPAVKFTTPTVANGKVYVGGQSTFVVFGLLPN